MDLNFLYINEKFKKYTKLKLFDISDMAFYIYTNIIIKYYDPQFTKLDKGITKTKFSDLNL